MKIKKILKGLVQEVDSSCEDFIAEDNCSYRSMFILLIISALALFSIVYHIYGDN